MAAFALSDRVPASPLIGREREQAVLRTCFASACDGHGGLVLIGGEAGIGKTALAESLCQEAEEQGTHVLVGRCYDLTETPPYGPWVELFDQYSPSDALPLPATFAQRGSVGEVTSQAALFQQVVDFFRAVSTERPILLLLDDLHWADLASLDLLRFLARALATLPVLLVVTYRADELTRRHPLYTLLPMLVREASATRIDLRALRSADITALVRFRHPLPDPDALQLVAYLNERSEGNPFFLGELLRTLEEEGTLQQTDGGWSLGALAGVQVPPLLRQVIDGRLARLGDEAQALLAVAAVIGQDVPFAVWVSVSERDEAILLDTVEHAMTAHLADATQDGTGFRFVHALIREALYEGTLPMRRRALHRQVGQALAALPNPDPDAVAYHFQRAGDERAAEWLVRAGERAQHAHAGLTAADRYEVALALMESGTATATTRGWLLYRIAFLLRFSEIPRCLAYLTEASAIAATVDDRALAAIIRFLRAFLHANDDHRQGWLPELAAAVEELEALTAAEYALLNAQEGLDEAAGRTWRGSLIFHLALVGLTAEALAMGERFVAAVAPPTAGGMQRGLNYGNAHLGLGIAHALHGRPDTAGDAFTRAAEEFHLAGANMGAGQATYYDLELRLLPFQTDRVAARQERAAETERALQQVNPSVTDPLWRWVFDPLLLAEGDWAAVEASARANRARRHGGARRMANCLLARLMHARGESALAWAEIHDMLPDGPATVPGDGAFHQVVPMQRLAVMLALDAEDMQTARAWLEANGRWLAWNGTVLGQSERQALWARYHRQIGDDAQAYACAQSARDHATNPRQPLALLAAHRLLGELDTDAGRYDDADRHLDESLRLADACAAPYERALTLLAMAESLAATGERTTARGLLDEVRGICEPLGAQPALARADALAERLSIEPARGPQYPGGLSAREVEVLRLVAQGLTNPQVADRLYLSPRTVEQHLRSIYNKLGVSTRAAATHFAVSHGLA
jgi:DNA-binding CsgD family transcriptional regulator